MEVSMSGAENETDGFELQEDGESWQGEPDPVFGSYCVLSPGVQIVLEGRAVSAPLVE
jgi:hypothetical protein